VGLPKGQACTPSIFLLRLEATSWGKEYTTIQIQTPIEDTPCHLNKFMNRFLSFEQNGGTWGRLHMFKSSVKLGDPGFGRMQQVPEFEKATFSGQEIPIFFKGIFRTLNWRYVSTICLAICCGVYSFT